MRLYGDGDTASSDIRLVNSVTNRGFTTCYNFRECSVTLYGKLGHVLSVQPTHKHVNINRLDCVYYEVFECGK